MYHFIYKSINVYTGEFYIGVHSANTLEPDGYYGSGIKIKHQIKKYGKDNFAREILYLCETREEAFKKEKEIVTKQLLEDPLCLNLTTGGKGMAEDHTLSARQKIGIAASIRNKGRRYAKHQYKSKPGRPKGSPSPLKGRKNPHSEEHKINLRKSAIESWKKRKTSDPGAKYKKSQTADITSLLSHEEKLKIRRENYRSVAKYTPEERKERRRAAKLGSTQTDESKKKISDAMKALHAKRKLDKATGA